MTKNCVCIVHCVDTEGPMNESLDATFGRLKTIFGIKLEPSKENLQKLQRQEIDLQGCEAEVADVISVKRLNMNRDWTAVDTMLDEILSERYRMVLPDSRGKGWTYSWFCMDHVGFTGNNPRRRDAGYHNIHDHYHARLQAPECMGDGLYFHYHPLPFSGDYNLSATAYVAGKNLFEILSRRIIDRGFFPSVYRPGFHTERPDSHWFLEQWIPFDYANQACDEAETAQRDMVSGRYGDWRRAPREWRPYHPSHDDYQRPGACHRWITRCLNMDARIRTLDQSEVDAAFILARAEGKSILAFTNHDFRDMRGEIARVREMIALSAEKYPDVQFVYCNALEAMRRYLGVEAEGIGMNVSIHKRDSASTMVQITSERSIFGSQPFFAIKTKSGQYFWDNLDRGMDENEWSYAFDANTFVADAIEKIGVAANSVSGVGEIVVCDFVKGMSEKHILNP